MGQRDFNHGLCSFYERPALFAAAVCCPCSVWATNYTRMTHLSRMGEPNPKPERVGLFCALYALSPNILGVGQIVMQVRCLRVNVRSIFWTLTHAVFSTVLLSLPDSRALQHPRIAFRGCPDR